MHSARASAPSSSSDSTKPGAVIEPCAPWRAISASTASRSGPSPKKTPRRPGTRSAARATAATPSGARFSGIMRPANTTKGSAGVTTGTVRGPA